MGRRRGVQFRMGSFYRSDDRSGFTRRAEDTRQEWNNLIVGKDLWEARQPQDLVRGVPDQQSVPNPRPIPDPVWDGPLYTTLSQAAPVGATFLHLNAINGFSAGGAVGVILDSGDTFNTTQVGNASASGITIAAPLPGSAASGNSAIAYEASGP